MKRRSRLTRPSGTVTKSVVNESTGITGIAAIAMTRTTGDTDDTAMIPESAIGMDTEDIAKMTTTKTTKTVRGGGTSDHDVKETKARGEEETSIARREMRNEIFPCPTKKNQPVKTKLMRQRQLLCRETRG